MRISVSAIDDRGLESNIAQHFGRCPYYVFVDITDDQIEAVEVLPNPYYENHTPRAVPAFINEHGADVMIAGGMGRRAIALFEQYQIKSYTGAVGTVRRALEQFHGGALVEAEPCKDHIAHSASHGNHEACRS